MQRLVQIVQVAAVQQEVALTMAATDQQLEMAAAAAVDLLRRLMQAVEEMEPSLVGEEAEVAAEQQATLVQAAMEQVVMFVFGLGNFG